MSCGLQEPAHLAFLLVSRAQWKAPLLDRRESGLVKNLFLDSRLRMVTKNTRGFVGGSIGEADPAAHVCTIRHKER